MVDWGVACLLAANYGSKVRCADNGRRYLRRGATVSADQLPLPTVVQRYKHLLQCNVLRDTRAYRTGNAESAKGTNIVS